MSEVLGASAGLPLWLDVTVGILLAVVLTITAELLARYAAKPARRSRTAGGRERRGWVAEEAVHDGDPA